MISGGGAETGGPGAYRRLPVAERRRQLLQAALELFSHRRPEDVSIDDIAAAAGASRPLVYRYFPGGRQQIYEAALGSAAGSLTDCFVEPPAGSPTERLRNVLDRYLAFVAGHAAGFSALVRGGCVTETSTTTAIIDQVRRAAAEQVFTHLAVERPGPRLRMAVRSWIAAVEAVSLVWLDEDRQPCADELRDWLVDHFVAVLAASAASDPQCAEVVRDVLAQERPDGPAAGLARRVLPLADAAAHLLG
ncbi:MULTISPECIES: TetR/AcrR family transcriptional regulator [Streptomycetaceae]|nr:MULTISPECIES: TetR/AcrR family transcriptional regulator [Streptomycetaceae]MYS61004.1 TetR family transcriptional regulator [Streptomyces sp. SID5468]CCB76837.1 putative TetR-family transcriptional regulator [Streptantibioticus cattleyicolor NRRL 8057 = DSM 46488]